MPRAEANSELSSPSLKIISLSLSPNKHISGLSDVKSHVQKCGLWGTRDLEPEKI